MEERPHYTLELGPGFDCILRSLKRRDKVLFQELGRAIRKALRNLLLGKPLRNVLRNCRRVHVGGSFVLLYEVRGCQVWLLDFDHHDRIYKKYS